MFFFYLLVHFEKLTQALLGLQHNSGLSHHSSYRKNDLHKAVDLVCDDYGVINAPFSGSLAGPVRQTDSDGNQFDGVKLLSDGKDNM